MLAALFEALQALLATTMLPLFIGSYLSYNEGIIGLTMPYMIFHARNRKLYAGPLIA